jgi:NtrC-family two-component system response regulator AlgB
MPPLRALHEDLIRLAEHYAKHFSAQCARSLEGFTSEAMTCLRTYPWPGNLREMRNAVERAVILARQDRIVPEDFPAEMRPENSSSPVPTASVGAMVSLEKLEELHIHKVLERIPNLGEAATILGIDQATLYRKRKKFGLARHRDEPEGSQTGEDP